MDRTERFYKIERLLRSRGCVNFESLLEELGVSPATLKRDLDYLRGQLGAPIEYDRDSNSYRFAAGVSGTGSDRRHELPGLWFSEPELYSLLMAHQLLSELDAEGVISRHLQPLLERIHQMLGNSEVDAKELLKRVKIISPAKRPVPTQFFELVAEALLKRSKLHIRYLTRGRGKVSERELSPQRLVHYRNTWYLDAWCHTREKLLRFALDAIEAANTLDGRAKQLSLKQLEAEMDGGYGIYAGAKQQSATLLFEAQAAQWVSREQWHADQVGRWLDDGRFELKLPYASDTEIIMDILRHGDDVQVLHPAALRTAVLERLQSAVKKYKAKAASD